ncbi:hypothetical protein BLNAU_9579 [Blattamonas nauphoetae]|uniref:Uncharacterized protein n=1 Tax=Blattamonas nauphoetae TaxID=2049346 RepID=A0ABQ9XVP2_9EUKA|nr:hypothetical protein BLNAU_9579 [Blattamonas nauphoetae]
MFTKFTHHTPPQLSSLPRDCPAWLYSTSCTFWFGSGGSAEGLSSYAAKVIGPVGIEDSHEGSTTVKCKAGPLMTS